MSNFICFNVSFLFLPFLKYFVASWMIRRRWVYCMMSKSPYSVRIKQNTDQKKLRIWTSLTQWYTYVWSLSRVQNNVQFDVYNVFQTIYVICGVRSFENVATFHLLKVIFICKQVHYIMVIFYEFIILIYYNCEFIFYNYWDMTPVINADRYKK